MRRLCVILGMVLLGWGLGMASETPQLTDILRLRAELQKTQELLLQAQYQLATCQAQQRAGVLAGTRRQVEQDVPSGYTLDWETLTLKPVEKK